MKIDDLFPLIVILLIVIVSLLKALFRAFSSAQQKQPGQERPSVWAEFKKALQTMAEEQRERREVEEEEGEEWAEEPPVTTNREAPAETEQPVVIVTPRVTRRGMPERIAPAQVAVPQVTPIAPTPHRPEDLGAGIAKEVSDIVHPPVEEHLRARGLVGPVPGALAFGRAPGLAAMLHLSKASPAELRRAIMLYEVLGHPLAERPPSFMSLK